MLKLLALSAIISLVYSWHVCQDELFCALLQDRGESHFSIIKDTINIEANNGIIKSQLLNINQNDKYNLEITFHPQGVFRIKINSISAPNKPIPSALVGNIGQVSIETFQDDSTLIITTKDKKVTLEINLNVFTIKSINNANGHVVYINKPQDMFLSDSIAMKISFNNSQHSYGIPEHGERLLLKDTKNSEPYRHFNLDYGYYKVESPESLYGSVPVLYTHGFDDKGGNHVSGVFWHNPAQTFVHLDHSNDAVTADFITEAGTLDLFVLTGGEFEDTVKSYVMLTGVAPLPPLFALGYHQSRYSYLTQEDVLRVASKLKEHEFPVDVLWLDIDYTDGKRYFTWNYTAFPEPLKMQQQLQSDNLHLVTIIDPHIKAENGYWVYDQMKANEYYVMNSDGSIYEGSCWPGLSSYVDFFNPDALKWWGALYNYSNYQNTTSIVHIWNDMNEPSVFDVDEKTMAKDIRHYGNIQHKEVHNMYGYLQTKGTFEGLLARDNNAQRPFILTRSHFAGSQRYSAIWTGDNIATWEHLRVSIPICLTEALAGISFCGADVGGFIERPTEELFQRWYQLGAWYPFFRAHSNNEQDYREPFLYPEEVQNRMRHAIQLRYKHLPYWYTTFYEHERYGAPIIRPLVYEHSHDRNVISIDEQFYIGKHILVAPVLYEGATSINVYLPEGIWYAMMHDDYNDVKVYNGPGSFEISVDMDSIPVFYRGGSIILRQDTIRQSTAAMSNDSYNLYVFELNNQAQGTFYLDDFGSYNYRNKEYKYTRIIYENQDIKFEPIDEDNSYDKTIIIDTVYVFSANEKSKLLNYKKAIITDGKTK